MWYTIAVLLYAIFAMSTAFQPHSSLLDGKVHAFHDPLRDPHDYYASRREFQYVVAIGELLTDGKVHHFVATATGVMFASNKALTSIPLNEIYNTKNLHAETGLSGSGIKNLNPIVDLHNLAQQKVAFDALWTRPTDMITVSLKRHVDHLTTPSHFPTFGKEGLENLDINIIIFSDIEKYPRQEKMFLKMKLNEVNKKNCLLPNNDDRLCFELNKNDCFLEKSDEGAPVLYGNNIVGIVTIVVRGNAMVEKIYDYIPNVYMDV